MPFGLIKYGFSSKYPARRDIPPPTDLKSSYDIVIIGAGGHGLAIAYYLSKVHGITNIAVVDKGYIGGGNTARNTAVIRSNYITPESTKFYIESLDLYRELSNEFDYNIMYSERGQLTLAHSDSAIRSFRLRCEVNKHLGGKTEMLDRQQIKELVPTLNMSEDVRHPIMGGLWHIDGATARHDAVAWGYARGAAQRGVEIHQNTEVTGIDIQNGKAVGVRTNRGNIKCGQVVQAVAGSSSLVAKMAGIRLPIKTYPLQAMVTQPLKPFLTPMISSAALHTYVSQSGRGEVVIGGGSDPYELYNTRSTLDMKESLALHTLELFPFLANVKMMRQWAGITDMTPDYSPIMGESPVQNYWLDAGWGTWGFKSTPISGKRMAEAVATGKVPEILQPFKLDRFRTYDLVNEMGATAASH
jgi:sarcosine oxidase subunit beta